MPYPKRILGFEQSSNSGTTRAAQIRRDPLPGDSRTVGAPRFSPYRAERQTPTFSPLASANARRNILRRLGPRGILVPGHLVPFVYKPRTGGEAHRPAPNRP